MKTIRAALAELVSVEDLHIRAGLISPVEPGCEKEVLMDEWRRRIRPAWAAARAALAAPAEPPRPKRGYLGSTVDGGIDDHDEPEELEPAELPPLPEPAAETRWWEAFNATELSLLRSHPGVEKYWGNRDKLVLFTADQMRAYALAAIEQKGSSAEPADQGQDARAEIERRGGIGIEPSNPGDAE